ncbi:MAG: hypothetical protein WED33_10620 [Bacteroidia bacterium]
MLHYIAKLANTFITCIGRLIFSLLILTFHIAHAQTSANLTAVVASNFNKVSNDSICKLASSSLEIEYDDEHTRIMQGTYTISDDNQLIVFQVEIESCGAYCNSFYESVILENSTETDGFKVYEVELAFKADSVLSLPKKNMYLFMGEHSHRPRGVEGVACLYAVVLDFSENKIAKEIQEITACNSNLSYSGEEDEFNISKLNYHPKTNTLECEFTWYEESDQDFKIYKERGYYYFVNDKFIENEKEIIFK